MTSNQPTFQLSGIHTSQPVSLLVYAWNKKGRSEAVTAMEDVIIMADSRSQSPELPPSVVMKEPLFFVIGGAVLGFLVISLLSAGNENNSSKSFFYFLYPIWITFLFRYSSPELEI